MPKITKRVVDALRADPAGKDTFVWDAGDGALKGFGIRMKPSGAASYLVQYRNKEGRTRRLALAKIATLTPEEARSVARDRLSQAAKGNDPSADRHASRKAITVAELCDTYLADSKSQGRIKASTLSMDSSRIETHVKPLLGRHAIQSLTSADITRLQAAIIAGKTAKPRAKTGRGGLVTGGPSVAARTIGMLSTILEYARQSLKLIKENPVGGVKRPADGKQRRFLDPDEIEALGNAMADDRGGLDRTAFAAIRFLLLSGFRRMEALALPCASLDTRLRCARLEDTKSGYQLRALGAAALRTLQLQAKGRESSWFFPAARGQGHFVGLPKVLERVCRKARLDGVTVHVLRHTFAATAAEMGFSELTIAGLLGHTVPGVTARYAHVADSALVAAADRVSARIAGLLGGSRDSKLLDFAAAGRR